MNKWFPRLFPMAAALIMASSLRAADAQITPNTPVILDTAGVKASGVAIPPPLQTPPRIVRQSDVKRMADASIESKTTVAKPLPSSKSAQSSPSSILRLETNGTGDWDSGSYAYDGTGNVYAIGQNYYVYDGAGRLVVGTPAYAVGTERAGYKQTFGYDAWGNLTALHTEGDATVDEDLDIDPATNRLTDALSRLPVTDPQHRQNYDAAGNMTHIGDITYTWDALNVMTGKTGEQYLYDADDERLATITSTSTTYTLRGSDQKVLRELNYSAGKWSWQRDFVYRDDLLLAQVMPPVAGSGPVIRHFHLDHLGTPRIVTNESGSRTATMLYWPYGVEAPGTDLGDGRDPLRYTGHEHDKDGSVGAYDLNYMHARYQLARKGRFLSMDPTLESVDLARPQSWNRYAYVNNNPIAYNDPTGRCAPLCTSALELGLELLEQELQETALVNALGLAVATITMATSERPPVDKADEPKVPEGSEMPEMLGASGTKTDSKTLWPAKNKQAEDGTRVDVENPAPGERPGQVQIQRGKGKNKETYVIRREFDANKQSWEYRIVDPKTGGSAPGWVAQVLKDGNAREAIFKGMQEYLKEQGFNFTKLIR